MPDDHGGAGASPTPPPPCSQTHGRRVLLYADGADVVEIQEPELTPSRGAIREVQGRWLLDPLSGRVAEERDVATLPQRFHSHESTLLRKHRGNAKRCALRQAQKPVGHLRRTFLRNVPETCFSLRSRTPADPASGEPFREGKQSSQSKSKRILALSLLRQLAVHQLSLNR